jgi:hypothetical protein
MLIFTGSGKKTSWDLPHKRRYYWLWEEELKEATLLRMAFTYL